MDDHKVTGWERIASFLGVHMNYDLDSGVLAMDVKSKIEKNVRGPLDLECS